MHRVSEMNTTTLLFSDVNGLIYYDMLEFNDLKCEAFKNYSTSMQLLYMFQDALRMLNGSSVNHEHVVPQNCELSSNRFTIRLRVYDLNSISFPVLWFASQYHAFRSVRPKSCSRVDVEPTIGYPSYICITYSIWFDDPIPF